jgi:hypothetical protein
MDGTMVTVDGVVVEAAALFFDAMGVDIVWLLVTELERHNNV